MSDEIDRANVITIVNKGGLWTASIGPAGLGLVELGRSPVAALRALVDRITRHGWPFDPTWKPEESVI